MEYQRFPTSSHRQECYSHTTADFGYSDQAIPGYIKSHVYREHRADSKKEYILLPNFRLSTHIHWRSVNIKRLGVETGEGLRLEAEVDRCGWDDPLAPSKALF